MLLRSGKTTNLVPHAVLASEDALNDLDHCLMLLGRWAGAARTIQIAGFAMVATTGMGKAGMPPAPLGIQLHGHRAAQR